MCCNEGFEMVASAYNCIDSVINTDSKQFISIDVVEYGNIIQSIEANLALFNKYKFKRTSTDKTEIFQWHEGNASVNIVVKKDVAISPEEHIAEQKRDIEQWIKIHKNYLYKNGQFNIEPDFDKTFNDYTPKKWRGMTVKELFEDQEKRVAIETLKNAIKDVEKYFE